MRDLPSTGLFAARVRAAQGKAWARRTHALWRCCVDALGFLQRHACFDVFFTSDSMEGAMATILALGTRRMTPMSSALGLFSGFTAPCI